MFDAFLTLGDRGICHPDRLEGISFPKAVPWEEPSEVLPVSEMSEKEQRWEMDLSAHERCRSLNQS